MDDLLTTKQLRDLLQVDRITIYRMLYDGRLHGFKVGGQWRFSRQEIEAWLQAQRVDADADQGTTPSGGQMPPSSQVLPLSCVQAIQGLCAEALEVATVTVDLDGEPLSDISHSCAFCDLILSTDEGRRRCTTAWKSVGNGEAQPCHAGLLCVSIPIKVSDKPVAIVAGCQFVGGSPTDRGQMWHAHIPALAANLGLDEGALQAAAQSVRIAPEDSLPRIARLLRRVAATFSEIGQERLSLLSRLQHIAEMSRI